MATMKREMVLQNTSKNPVKDFEKYWEANLKESGKIAKHKNFIEDFSLEFRIKTSSFDDQISEFQNFLQKVPVISAIKAWLETKLLDAQKDFYQHNISLLLNKKINLFADSRGEPISLEYLIEHGHQGILEDIRTTAGWTFLEKEHVVQTYVSFSNSLARLSHGLIPPGVDPDRALTQNKSLSYETFIDFIPHLSERDSLVAKLMYFCSIPMDEILKLKRDALQKNSSSINLQNGKKPLPRHLFCELEQFSTLANDSQALLFTNFRGEEVDRTHINQSFARASEKSLKKEKITPSTLLKLKT